MPQSSHRPEEEDAYPLDWSGNSLTALIGGGLVLISYPLWVDYGAAGAAIVGGISALIAYLGVRLLRKRMASGNENRD